MAIHINANGKKSISDIFANVNGEKKAITSAWVNKDGIAVKVFDKSVGSYIYVLIGSSGLKYTYDFSTYHDCTLPYVGSASGMSNIAYGNGVFVVKYQRKIYYSNDGKTFAESDRSSHAGNNTIFFINGMFIEPISATIAYVSTDGANWTAMQTTNAPTGLAIGKFAYVGNEVVVITGMNEIYRSSDGITWTITAMTNEDGTASILSTTCQGFEYANGKYLVYFTSVYNYESYKWGTFNVLYSEDGVHFKPIKLDVFSTNYGPNKIVYFQKTGKFYAAYYIPNSAIYKMYESTDGYTWTKIAVNIDEDVDATAIFDGGDVLIQTVFQYKSADGINWVSTGSSYHFTHVMCNKE